MARLKNNWRAGSSSSTAGVEGKGSLDGGNYFLLREGSSLIDKPCQVSRIHHAGYSTQVYLSTVSKNFLVSYIQQEYALNRSLDPVHDESKYVGEVTRFEVGTAIQGTTLPH